MIDLSLFRFSCPIEVRFADMDALGHVNNAKYFTYMETSRLLYFREVIGWQGGRSELGVILARATCDFKMPLVLGNMVRACTRITRIGDKSFDFEYVLIHTSDNSIAAIGTSVQVAYNYDTASSIPTPENWRDKMIAYEPALS